MIYNPRYIWNSVPISELCSHFNVLYNAEDIGKSEYIRTNYIGDEFCTCFFLKCFLLHLIIKLNEIRDGFLNSITNYRSSFL
jgi:hypothetical protein